ncbi:hypothetical protein FNW52_13355 [Flavobacterium sp. ZT3R18]|uniref:hypothetical protein n=1 Tax=Flavobacterium sp. ZT3R18 TaxID=2594429 RepID=UPI00117A658B|nr:hypothetical protein [Flavobacterium sp. ZT3R18]TRX34808.1 hypothetical protein FNW52_13355 [Flavobacterium sp. ZT3R18]
MKLEDIGHIINDIEKRFAVDEWEIDGIKFWPLIRIENYSILSYQTVNSGGIKTRSLGYVGMVLKAKIRRLIAMTSDLKNNASLKKVDILLKSDGVSFTKLHNTWYEKFCDPIVDYYKNTSTSTLRLDDAHYFYSPRYSPSIFIQTKIDNIIIKALLINKVIKIKFEKENWVDYEKFLEDGFANKNFATLPGKEVVRAKVYKIKKLKAYYISVLQKTKPRLALVVSYYCDSNMAFIQACNDLGIKTIDIQHGVQGELHLAYSKWEKVPKIGYGLLPDYFLVWSDDEKDIIDTWNTNVIKHKALISGNMFSEIWKDNSSRLVKDYDEAFNKTKKNNVASILVTLSPGMCTDELMGETWKLLKNIQNQYDLFIRLHPVMMSDKFKIIKKLNDNGIVNFEIDICSVMPLYTVLRNIDIHITVQSTVVIEASEFAKPSIITSEYGASLYKKLIKNKLAYFCENHTKMKDLIENLLAVNTLVIVDEKQPKKNIFDNLNQILNGE